MGAAGRSPEELASILTWLVMDAVTIDAAELAAARRRAMLVLAAGGDPHRDLRLDDVAVERLAAELNGPERLAALTEALHGVAGILDTLRGDPELAWRVYALALLADELADE